MWRLLVCLLILVSLWTPPVQQCGISSHIEAGERAKQNLHLISEGVDYAELLQRHEDAFQAGCPYPDAYYPDLCFDGVYHDVAEDAHWTPFMNATINYIRREYSRPWSEEAEKLIVFLFGIMQHQVADVNWHSLGIDQGFLDTMGKINYHGSFGAAHSDGDFGGDVLNLFGLDMDYIGMIQKWYVPTDDLVRIHNELYGQDVMSAEVVENCTMWLFLGRLGENLGVIEVLHPLYARRSPFMTDRLQDFFLGGMDDMSVWSTNLWYHTVTMLDHGVDVCDLPENPIYVECNVPEGDRRSSKSSERVPHPQRKHFSERDLLQAVGDLAEEDVTVERTDKGVYFKAAPHIEARIQDGIQHKILEAKLSKEHQPLQDDEDGIEPVAAYLTNIEYSRLGESMLSGDVNNDGYQDLIIGAPGYSSQANYQQGRVYIVYGSEDGLPVEDLLLEEEADQVLDGPQLNGRFGVALALIDLNADGVNDLAVSAPSVGSESLDFHGEVYVFFGSEDMLSPFPDITVSCTERYCNLGWSLSAADLNGDNFADLIIGAPFAPGGERQRGFVSVFYADQSIQEELTELDSDWRMSGEQEYQWLGYSVTGGSTSGGQGWLVAGSPSYRLCHREDCGFDQRDIQAVGAVYGFQTPLTNTPSFSLFGEQEFTQMGYSVSMGVYGDDDVIVISSVTASVEGQINGTAENITQAGDVILYSLDEDGGGDVKARFTGDREFARFGNALLLEDLTGDGINDVIITAPLRSQNSRTAAEEGRVFVFSGDAENTDRPAEEAEIKLLLDVEKTRLGSSAATVRGLQHIDVAVAGAHSNHAGRLAGRVFIYRV